ncbi:DUF4350 domain-containing protein [Aquibacillus sediminis]|uniref:DUF4350 domain-containing protein n=1 Tax=Aquibacillus sediminis TaxID=2574734 RepID=UPI00110A0492|nr:DUF4350 domain-containing protein [Aquibacillus sediminis]
MNKYRAWMWLASFLIVFLVVSLLVSSPQPKEYPDYASDSPSPTGVKGLYTYLDDVSRWSSSPELLATLGNNQLLVMVEPYFIPETPEMKAYMDFIETGNTILLLHSNPKGMFDIDTSYIMEQAIEPTVVFNKVGEKYDAEVDSFVRLKTKDRDESLLYDDRGTIALKRSYGEGALIVANTPKWVTNEELLNQDHLSLVQLLLQLGTNTGENILFDEYIHGAKNTSNLTTLYPRWLLVLGLQCILLTFIWLWYRGKRFGPIFIAREETVRFNDERLKALAAWYQRGKRYHDSLVIQADYLKMLLQGRFGTPQHMHWQEIADYIQHHQPTIVNKETKEVLNGLGSLLERKEVSKQEYLLWSKRIDRLQRKVEQDER